MIQDPKVNKEKKRGSGYKNLTDQKFNRLTAKYDTEKRVSGKHVIWFCKCDCGKELEVPSQHLVSGHTKSCGCLNIELRTTHGMSKTKEYSNYQSSKRRATLLQRTPKWLTDKDWIKIRKIYLTCPKGYDVDHKIPLQGELASGLHIPENLQHLIKFDNISKNNKFEPIYE